MKSHWLALLLWLIGATAVAKPSVPLPGSPAIYASAAIHSFDHPKIRQALDDPVGMILAASIGTGPPSLDGATQALVHGVRNARKAISAAALEDAEAVNVSGVLRMLEENLGSASVQDEAETYLEEVTEGAQRESEIPWPWAHLKQLLDNGDLRHMLGKAALQTDTTATHTNDWQVGSGLGVSFANHSAVVSDTLTLDNNYEMPAVGFGTRMQQGTYQAVLSAITAGYRHIDTAQSHGNEQEIGEAVTASGIDRSEFFISTKLSTEHDFGHRQTRERCLKQMELLGNSTDLSLAISLHQSLYAGVDYLDLYMIHAPLGSSGQHGKRGQVAIH